MNPILLMLIVGISVTTLFIMSFIYILNTYDRKKEKKYTFEEQKEQCRKAMDVNNIPERHLLTAKNILGKVIKEEEKQNV